MVKGVTWDPIGKYLASQSDDRTVRIWRTYSWKPEAVVSDPFKEVCLMLIMAALCNRAGHLYFHPVVSFFFFFYSSPNLSRRRLDAYHTSTHGVALVRI